MAVRVVGASGESLMFNEACRAIWGIPAGGTLPPWNQQKGWNAQIKRAVLIEEWPVARALSGIAAVPAETIHIQGFDGVLREVMQSAVPLLDESGALFGAVEVTEDVTRLMTPQDTARRRQEQLEAAFDAAHLSFWDWNLGTNHVTWSGPFEQLFTSPFNGSADQADDLLRRLHPDDAEQVRQAVEESRNQCTPFEQEFRVIYPTGTVHWISAKGRFTYRAGKAVRMTGVVTDITLRKIAEDDLRHAKDAAEQAEIGSRTISWRTSATSCARR